MKGYERMRKKRIGIMGGTFDPIHIGHLAMAENVREQIGLDEVLFIPAAQPPHKRDRRIAPAQDRMRMTELAVADNPYFQASAIELEREGPSYSLFTIRELQLVYGNRAEFYFLIGSDAINELPSWYHAREVVTSCCFITMVREGTALDLSSLRDAFGDDVELDEHIRVIHTPLLEISSTDIRRRVHEGRSLRYLVPRVVADYIYEKGLYK